MPNPHTLFSLKPYNTQAQYAISHSNNTCHVSTLSDGEKALDIGFHIRGKSSTTLATLGRGVDADIYVEESMIAKIQCSFEIDLEAGVIMFYDRSHSCTTQVFGEIATPFEHGRIRKVLIQEDINTIIGMGGAGCGYVQFALEWHQDKAYRAQAIENYNVQSHSRVENPRLSRTIDEVPTDLPSRLETTPHTPAQLQMRFVTVGPPLGSGNFGTVHKAIDVDTGKFIAVKIVERPQRIEQQKKWRTALKREVKVISSINHPHIIHYIASQGWDEPKLMIFTSLMTGTLETLIESGVNNFAVAELVYPQMLRALDHTAFIGIVHRDVKPENILYQPHPDIHYQFQLADFGLCNLAVNAVSRAGTHVYMAPEIISNTGLQSSKVDVWSLFVTMLWVLDGEFRKRSFTSQDEILEAILSGVSRSDLSQIQEMAIVNPAQRASAAQMLVKIFDGVGLSTAWDQIPALTSGGVS